MKIRLFGSICCIVFNCFIQGYDKNQNLCHDALPVDLVLACQTNNQYVKTIASASKPIVFEQQHISIYPYKYSLQQHQTLDAFVEQCCNSAIVVLPANVYYPQNVQSKALLRMWNACLVAQTDSDSMLSMVEKCFTLYRAPNNLIKIDSSLKSLYRMIGLSWLDSETSEKRAFIQRIVDLGIAQEEYSARQKYKNDGWACRGIASCLPEPLHTAGLCVHPLFFVEGVGVWAKAKGLLIEYYDKVKTH